MSTITVLDFFPQYYCWFLEIEMNYPLLFDWSWKIERVVLKFFKRKIFNEIRKIYLTPYGIKPKYKLVFEKLLKI